MERDARRSGWVTLVGVLLIIVGGFNLIWALAAIGVSLGGNDSAVVGELSYGTLEGLGIAGLIVGSLQVFAGIGILNRLAWGWAVGMGLAIVAVLLNFGYHRVLEGWAFSGLVVNLIVIVILSLRREEFVSQP
jgi:hypothetical protein